MTTMVNRLLLAAIDVIKQYDIRLTVRQIYYRLVSASVIKNSRSAYNSLDKILVNARLAGTISFDAIEDRSREFLAGDIEDYETPERFVEWRLEALKDSDVAYEMPYWLNQPQYVEVWVEKDALASLISQACNRYHVRLAPCKGYPSVSFLYEAAEKLRNVDLPITLLYFGDFDMRGKDIERYIIERFEGFGVTADVQRIALTRQQVESYNLPPQPAKKTDTMAQKWIETQGDVAWELDALEPTILLSLVETAVLEHLDKDVLEKRNERLRQNREKIREIVEKLFAELGN